MYARLREHFGATALILSVAALVLALAGGAIAANSSGGGATASAKGKKGPKGPKGAKGDPGAPGAKGDKGDPGAAGTNGTNGTNGKDGETVTVATASTGECPHGGSKFSNASGSGIACNGAPGVNGENPKGNPFTGEEEPAGEPCNKAGGTIYEIASTEEEELICNGTDGSPWTVGGTLPPGATEGGVWVMQGQGYPSFAPISFTVPLAQELEEFQVHLAGEADFGSKCHGSAGSHPNPAPGELCVYENSFEEVLEGTHLPEIETGTGSKGAGRAGALVIAELGANGYWYGTFSVTGCSKETGAEFPCPSPPPPPGP